MSGGQGSQLVRVVRVFVSSPGDVALERKVLEEAAARINEDIGKLLGLHLELFRWERDVVPRIGPPAQVVVDAQTPPYDVYLGIMARRFGTPGEGYGSGTEKELRDALRKWETARSPWFLFYFDQSPVRPDQLDLKQYGRLQKFRKEMEEKGLVALYEGVRGSEKGFFEQVQHHLRLLLQNHFGPQDQEQRGSREGRHQGRPVRQSPAVTAEYREWLARQVADVDLLGLDFKDGRAIRLSQVYVPLTTVATDEPGERIASDLRERASPREARPQLLLDLLGRDSLYVWGAPGSGKSIFCRWVAWLVCRGAMPAQAVEPPEGYAESFPEALRGRLPLLVPLREIRPYLPVAAGQRDLSRAQLEDAIGRWLHAKEPQGIEWADVEGHLHQGSALLILDGVDEVPPADSEGKVLVAPRSMLLSGLADAVPVWTGRGNRVLVTSRPYGLTDGEARRLGVRIAPIGDLDEPQQGLLVRRWFHILVGDPAAGEAAAREMLDHVAQREDLEALRASPMLLPTMCTIYHEGRRLPQDRYELYTRLVDHVLFHRYPHDRGVIDLVRNRLCVVAYGMHTGDGLGEARATPEAETTHREIDRMIEAYQQRSRWTEQGFEGAVTAREDLLSHSGLLLPREGHRASFYHLSVQEFLAAERAIDLEGDRLLDFFRSRGARAEWRNTLAFAFAGQLARNRSPERAIGLLEALIEALTPEALGLQVVVAECLEVLMGRGVRLRPELEGRFRDHCLAAIEREAPLAERHRLGLTLGRLGDPRVARDLRRHDDPAAYVEVPAGDYVIGGERRRFTLEAPIRLGRFPVTNGQFSLFIDDRGYEDGLSPESRWWSEGGRQWLSESRVKEPRFWRSTRWSGPTQPVVGVSFWEAEAFCAWAGGRLPDEREWEAAARGPEGLEYPWGKWQDGICNTAEAGLGMTSAVGLFPRSRSKPRGLEDMAGNVLEWCSDASELHNLQNVVPDSVFRVVLRGGSWGDGAGLARSAFRNFLVRPDVRFFGVGFRVVGAGGVRTP